MAKFRKVSGVTKLVYLPVTPSTPLAEGILVTVASGKLVAAAAGTVALDLTGILRKAIVSTDADYATERLVPVEVPLERHVLYEFETVAAVAGDIGNDVDLVDADTVDRSAVAVGVVKILKVLSGTKCQGWIKFNGSF